MNPVLRRSYSEATARQRVAALMDPGSFRELVPPADKCTSPHLDAFRVPVSLDDGVVIGDARAAGRPIGLFAQEGRFMGGAIGEIHSAKIVGLIRRAIRVKAAAVVGLLDSGGVRLQEANAGEIGVSEILRAVFDARAAGIPVIGLVGGASGVFGGAGILSGCCDVLIVSDHGRVGVSGPEVIETTQGVEAFDSRDRALVWRTTGGKHRYLLGVAGMLVDDDLDAFRRALAETLEQPPRPPVDGVERGWQELERRWNDWGACRDAVEIWRAMGIREPERIPDLDVAAVRAARPRRGERP